MFHGLCHLIDAEGCAKNKICPECDTPFKVKRNKLSGNDICSFLDLQVPIGLKHHLITHTGETPFLCLHCWKSFSSHIDLKVHIKKEHLMHLNTDTGGKAEILEAKYSPTKSNKAVKTIKRNSNGVGEIKNKYGYGWDV